MSANAAGARGRSRSGNGPARRRPTIGVVLVAALILIAPGALADVPRVIVASSPAATPKPGLTEAVAIQLSGLARVEEGPELAGATPRDRIAEASALASDRGASLVVWIDATGDHERALHAVGPTADGEPVLITVSEVPQGAGPEVERALALTVWEALDQPARHAEHPREDDLVANEPAPAPLGQTRARSRTAIGEMGAGITGAGGNVGAQGETNVAAGVALDAAGGRIELVGGLRFARPTEVEGAAGRVQARELAAGAGGRFVMPRGQALVGAHASAGAHASVWVRRVRARGEAATGATGSVRRFVPVARLGPEIRWDLHPQLALRAAGAAEISMRRQWFTIHSIPVSDLGRLRLAAEISIVASW